MKKPRGFHFFTGDRNWLDYGGVWMRHVDGERFHFIRLDNMDEACGRDNEGHPTYSVDLSEVNLSTVTPSEITSAMQCYGIDRRDIMTDDDDGNAATLAECVRSYGIASPLHSVRTNNAHKGITECRRESYRLTRDAEAYEAAMERPVNAIGSTAREFGRGDLNSALVRGLEAGDKTARIIGKMYIAAKGQTLGGKLPESELAAIKKAYDRP